MTSHTDIHTEVPPGVGGHHDGKLSLSLISWEFLLGFSLVFLTSLTIGRTVFLSSCNTGHVLGKYESAGYPFIAWLVTNRRWCCERTHKSSKHLGTRRLEVPPSLFGSLFIELVIFTYLYSYICYHYTHNFMLDIWLDFALRLFDMHKSPGNG